MKYSENIKPISYLKSHAAEVIKSFESGQEHTIVVTHNGEAKAVLQDIRTYEKTKESMAMLKLLAQSSHSLKQGKFKSAAQTFRDLRNKIKKEK